MGVGILIPAEKTTRGPHKILSTRGEKAQTSKRVSVIACNNVISKAKLCDAFSPF